MNKASDHSLTARDIQYFFNLFGWLLPFSNSIDSAAYKLLAARGDFSSAKTVLDIGAGTGHLADLLLRDYLPGQARCTLIEVAGFLADVLRSKFSSYGDRVSVELVGVSPPYPFTAESFERIISSYVFDMMNSGELEVMVNETHRLLARNGLLCLLVTGRGVSAFSRIVMGIWSVLHKIDPRLVGISRPIGMLSFFHQEKWEIVSVDCVSRFGFSSEIIILKKIA